MIDGCFDLINILIEIERSEVFNIQYQPLNQSIHQKYFSVITLYIIQLKLDHFEKKYFLDYLSPSQRVLLLKHLLEISNNGKHSY